MIHRPIHVDDAAKPRKGIILAGGSGTRLHPMTSIVIKQLLPLYDKPMIYYPLSTLMLIDVRDILLIIKPEDQYLFEKLLGDGSHLGMTIRYQVQLKPKGLPEAFTLGRDFIGDDPVTLILGDNVFYGSGLPVFLTAKPSVVMEAAHAFTFTVPDPQRFGVVEYDERGGVTAMVEKPPVPRSNQAMAGIYHLPSDVAEKAAQLKPSARGELEMVDLLQLYLNEQRLYGHRAPRGFAWLDTGTVDAMLKASQFVQIIEERQGQKIACIEEIAYNKGWIDAAALELQAQKLHKSGYGGYLRSLIR